MSAGTILTTEEEIEAYLKTLIGQVGETQKFVIERGATERMARCMEDYDEIYFEAEAAKARGYRGIVAPLPYIWHLAWMTYNACQPEGDVPFGTSNVHGEGTIEFGERIIVGDEITATMAVVSTAIKHGRSGRLVFMERERRFTNQFGHLCAVVKATTIRR